MFVRTLWTSSSKLIALYLVLLLPNLITTQQQQSPEEHHCVWYGQCGNSPTNYEPLNCPYDGPAKQLLEENAQQTMLRLCPNVYQSSKHNLIRSTFHYVFAHLFFFLSSPSVASDRLCCDAAQVQTLSQNIAKAEVIFGRCQTCISNMLLSICAFTCAPDQTRFMNATVDTLTDFFGQETDVVISIDINIDTKFVADTYDSCQGVVNPATGTTAMDIACGIYDAKTCTPQRYGEKYTRNWVLVS